MTTTTPRKAALAAAVLTALPGTASAASFYIIESSAGRLGNAFAGTASAADDASTVYFNAAGMTRLDGPTVSVAGHFILPESEFSNDGSTAATGTAAEARLSGPDDSTDDSALVPNFYYSTPLNDIVSLGLGINAPFGLTSEYEDDWVGRYHATNSALQTININPTLAFKATDRLSIGVGINYQSIDATLESEIDSAAACFSAREAQGFPVTGDATTAAGACATTHGGFGNRASDSSVEITGDDRGIGVDLGLMYEFDADTRVGLSWRQGVDYTLEGEVDFDQSATCAGDDFCSGATADGDVTADVELPDILTLSATHGVGAHWRVDGDVSWYDWDSIQALRIIRSDNDQEVSTLELDYDDTMRYALGLTYTGLGAITLRTGVAHDESPISSAETVTPRIPDGDRTWVTFGLNYALSSTASVDVGYAHLFVDEVRIDNTEQGNTLTGEFDPTVDILSVAANWRF